MREHTYINNYITHRNLGSMYQMQHRPEQKLTMQREIRILVVDDEEPLRDLLRISFQKAGYKVIVARDGREALDVFSRTSVDLVLLRCDDARHGRVRGMRRTTQAE